MTAPACKDCAYVRGPRLGFFARLGSLLARQSAQFDSEFAQCSHHEAITVGDFPKYADVQRILGSCGPDAKLFSARQGVGS